MLKILKYAKYVDLIVEFVRALERADNNPGATVQIRPSFKGKEYSLELKRTK